MVTIRTDHILLELFMRGSGLPGDYRLFEAKASVLFTDESPALNQVEVQQILNN